MWNFSIHETDEQILDSIIKDAMTEDVKPSTEGLTFADIKVFLRELLAGIRALSMKIVSFFKRATIDTKDLEAVVNSITDEELRNWANKHQDELETYKFYLDGWRSSVGADHDLVIDALTEMKKVNFAYLEKMCTRALGLVHSDTRSYDDWSEEVKNLKEERSDALWETCDKWAADKVDERAYRQAGGVNVFKEGEFGYTHLSFAFSLREPRSVTLDLYQKDHFVGPMLKFIKTFNAQNPKAIKLCEVTYGIDHKTNYEIPTVMKAVEKLGINVPYGRFEAFFEQGLNLEKDITRVYGGIRAYLQKSIIHDKNLFIRLVNAITSQRFVTGKGKISEEE